MIIQSLLDTDLYKFTMMQVVLHHFPGAQVEYRFKCRTEGVDLAPYVDEIRAELADLCKLRFRESELAYLRGLRFMKSDFVDFLGLFQFNEKYIRIERNPRVGRRHRYRDQGALAAHDPVRDPGAGDRLRGLFPPHAAAARLRRRAAPPAREDRAGPRQPGARPAAASPTTARAGASRACGTTK